MINTHLQWHRMLLKYKDCKISSSPLPLMVVISILVDKLLVSKQINKCVLYMHLYVFIFKPGIILFACFSMNPAFTFNSVSKLFKVI